MEADLKRFNEISGREALERLSKGLSVFEKNGTEVSINLETNEFKFVLKNGFTQIGDGNGLPLTIIAVLESPWYVKKPFDVRAEMLARPNEWVGAYQDGFGKWRKVGFSTQTMSPRQTNTSLESGFSREETVLSMPEEFSGCIPIEDVPEEELT